MSKRKALPPREELTVIEDRLLEEAQGQFWAEMDKVLAQFKSVLEKYRVPIVGKMELDDWKKTKEAFVELLFEVIDKADDDADGEHHRTISLTGDYNRTRKFPDAFYELMRIWAVDEFLKKHELIQIQQQNRKELNLPKPDYHREHPFPAGRLVFVDKNSITRDKVRRNVVDEVG